MGEGGREGGETGPGTEAGWGEGNLGDFSVHCAQTTFRRPKTMQSGNGALLALARARIAEESAALVTQFLRVLEFDS